MELKPITPDDYPKLKYFFEQQTYRLCEYSLPSIIVWSTDEYKPYGAVDGDTAVIGAEFVNRKEDRHLLLPVSPSREYSPEELCELAEKLKFDTYWFVPGDYIKKYGRKRVGSCFSIGEQKGFSDYVYLTSDLATLVGNKYSKKRNLIHQFEKNYLTNGNVRIEPIAASMADECIEFLEKWCLENNCDSDEAPDLACEKQAAINALKNIDKLGIRGLLLRLNGKVSAFGIASQLTADMGVLHFEKAFANIKGLYQYFDNLCAKQLLSGYKYINKESDMNIPGLAKAKKSYRPVMIIKSYTLTLNSA